MVEPGTLDERFRSALHAAALDRFTEPVDLEPRLAEARTTWPECHVEPERFAEELARRLGADASPARLAAAATRDVYLAIACSDGDTDARDALFHYANAEIDRCADRLRARDHVDEARAIVQQILMVAEPSRPAAVTTFSGRGDLRAYIRVIASRELVRLLEQTQRRTAVHGAAVLEALLPPSDPELALLRTKYREQVDTAIRAAIASLDDRSRALFRYNLIDGWNIEKIGAIYGVHRATIARWISQARELLHERIHEEIATRLEIDRDEVESIVRLVRSRVDISLERLLMP